MEGKRPAAGSKSGKVPTVAEDLEFPIVLRMRLGNKLMLLAISLFLMGCGAYLAGTESTMQVPVFGHMSSSTFGYIAVAIGIALGIAALQALVSERPKLLLD